MELVSSYIIVLITNYLLYLYLNTRYEINTNPIYIKIYIFLSSVIILIINSFQIPFLNILCYLIMMMAMDYFFYKPKNKIRYVFDEMIVIYFAILNTITHFFVEMIFRYLKLNIESSHLYYIKSDLSLLIIIAFCMLIKRYYLKKNGDYLSVKESIIFFIFPIGSIILLLMLGKIMIYENSSFLHGQCLILAVILMVLNLIIMENLSFLNENHKMEILYIEEKNKRRMQEEYYEEIKEKYEVTRQLIHDFKNHLNMLTIIKNEKNTELLDDYLLDIKENLDSTGLLFDSGNKIIDLIVTDKMKLCAKKGIDFEIKFSDELKNRTLKYISEFDMVGLLTNILDNAIEACEFIECRNIKLNFENVNEMVILILKNTCVNDFKRNYKGNMITTKKGHRGLGLSIVRKIVDKYDGFYSIDVVDGICVTKIVFPLKK